MAGLMTLGFFASADLALERERKLLEHLGATGNTIRPDASYFPITAKFFISAMSSVLLLSGVIYLVIAKDMDWLGTVAAEDMDRARLSILGEIAFIAAIILLGLFNLIVSYSRNLRILLHNENSSLRAVARGDFESRVTVGTSDEFGVMGAYTNVMIERLRDSVQEIKRTQEATVVALASLAEMRDMETGLHIIRTKLYVKALAEHLADHPKYRDFLTPEALDIMHKTAPLHDIGKVGIPDAVLLKPGRLTPDEFEIMKRHPVYGAHALMEAEKLLGKSSFLSIAREIAYSHHEKYDGSGYPLGLRGEAIPLSGRLMALADVYDALVFKRVYKPALSHEVTRGIILDDRGRHFDPDVVDAFLAIEDQFLAIAHEYREGQGKEG